MKDKVLTLLGFASKAGKLSFGFDAACTAISQKKSKLVLTACDISPKSQKEMLFYCDKFKTQLIVLNDCDMATISHAIGRKCGIVSVNDTPFSEGILTAINGRNVND